MKPSPPSASVLPPTLIRSKLTSPVAARQLITRARIVDRVFLAVGARLILVRAPAGFGKTTLMLELKDRYERDGAVAAWLHLDDADNDIARMLACLRQALEPALDAAAMCRLSEARISQGVAEQAIELIDSIAAARVPFVLFLDEFEVLRADAVVALVGQILERLPPGAQVVIGTRSVPDFGLGRLRARGHLVEVEPGELRLTEEETGIFLTQRRGINLNSEQVHRLHHTTEGWIAALWLASVSLERREDRDDFIARFTGSNTAVAEYLAEDVLARQSERVRDFLLRTSLLDTLSVPLCNVVGECEDGSELLQVLERANLFLVPLDSERTEYRYHSLFAEFLRASLMRQKPELLPRLHRLAADWYLQQERPIPAIRHAIASGDGAYAGQVLALHADQLMEQGRLRPLCHALDKLPAEVLDATPRLRLIHAWATLFTHGPRRALGPITAVEAQAGGTPEFEAHRLALEPIRVAMLERMEDAYELAVERWPRQNPEFRFPYRMAAQALSLTCMLLGRHTQARQLADEVRRSGSGATAGFSAQISEYVDAGIDLMQGRLRQAGARLKVAAGGHSANFDSSFNRNAMPGLLLAEVLYESNELQAAERLLGVYVPLVKDLGLADQLIVAHSLLSRIVNDSGDSERALMLLADLEAIGHRLELPRVVGSARLERARQALMRDDVERARIDLERAGDVGLWERVEKQWLVANDTATLSIGRFRWQVRSGAATRAVDRLKQAVEEAEQGQRHRRALKLRILLAEALHRGGQQKPAMRILGRALEIAAEEGFVRTFLEEGAYVETMVQESLSARLIEDRAASVPAALAAFGHALRRGRQAPVQPPAAAALADPLTSKEIRVLELLAEGLGNNAIGDRMFISESTVRAHLRSINSKLQASNRVQALVIARRLGAIQ